jgi:nitrile hydratase
MYAIRDLLLEKGVVTQEDLERGAAYFSARGRLNGARLVARAWTDDAFRARLLAEPKAACHELEIPTTGLHELVVLENTPTLRHIIVCTLCSCYPRPILGQPPDWYKSLAYRARAVREPRAVMREFGGEPDADVEVKVVDSTADVRYIVLPCRPPGTEDLDAEQLQDWVTRDCLVGVTEPRDPRPLLAESALPM